MVDWDNDPSSVAQGFGRRMKEFEGWPLPSWATDDSAMVEKFAIRCAKGNNGGEWETHYTEDQKNFWRQFVRDLMQEMKS